MATVLPFRQQQAGVLDTGNVDVAALRGNKAPQPNTAYVIAATMDAADLADTALHIQMDLYLDSQLVYPLAWTGGVRGRNGAIRVPSIRYSTGSILPTTVRLTVNLPRALRFGLDVSTVDM
jgi:hypothetical protein